MGCALGLIEVVGLAGAIEGADAMLKAANVTLIGCKQIGAGLVTVLVKGDLSAVKVAIEAGTISAAKVSEVKSVHMIPKLHQDLEAILPMLVNQSE